MIRRRCILVLSTISLLLLPPTTSLQAWIATSESILHAPPASSLSPSSRTLLFDGTLSPDEIYAKPHSATTTGIPFRLTSHAVNPLTSLCFLVEHLSSIKRSCTPRGANDGLLIIDQLGTPTITAVLRRHSSNESKTNSKTSVPEDNTVLRLAAGEDAPLLLAWSRFQITVVDEFVGHDLIREKKMQQQQQDEFESESAAVAGDEEEEENEEERKRRKKKNEQATSHWPTKVIVLNLQRQSKLLSSLLVHLSDHLPSEMDVIRQVAVDGAFFF
jgi:hypothetical protein